MRKQAAGGILSCTSSHLREDVPVVESSRGRERLERALEGLDRYKWWISGILAAGTVIWADPADPRSPMTWVVVGLFLVLLWIPAMVRVARGFRRTADAFKDGLNGH